MSTKFFTNREENTLINKFEGVFTYNPNIVCFDALVGYFRASGYFRIREFLNKVPKIRILVGINVDKLITKAHEGGMLFFANHDKTREEFIQETINDIQKAHYDKDTEEGIIQFIDDIITKKVEIKAHPDKKLHAKIYIFRPEPFNKHTPAQVITGSSNLTDAGLGFGPDHNYEFNVQLNDYEDVKFATDEFNSLWDEAIDILPADIEGVKKVSYLNDDVTPFELYIKLLIEYFGKDVDYDPDSVGDLPQNFKKLSYQIDAVNQGYNMMMEHNGFILADVVGLGKTVVAAMVAKKFLLQNGRENSKILVVYPPAVEKNWKNTFRNFKIDRHTKFITNGSLHKIISEHEDYWPKEEYDLVIVDEAHKFRNHTTDAFHKLQLICKSPRANKGYVPGQQKKVILVSATPLNNSPDDIFYQIQLFQDARESTLPVTNLTSFFGPLMDQYKTLKRYEILDVNKLREIYGKIRKEVIEPITIRRTRTDLYNNEDYKKDLDSQGIKFPKVDPPQKVEYVMDDKLNVLFHKTVEYLTKVDSDDLPVHIGYYRYQAIAGLKIEISGTLYEQAELVSKSLAYIMKTQLVKRLESSFHAFKKSLGSLLASTERMIEMFENDRVYIVPDGDINKMLDKGLSTEEIENEIKRLNEENPKNNIFSADDFEPYFVDSLIKDKRYLNELVALWNEINYDPKLDKFLTSLNKQFLNKRTNIEGKLVIFSESKDTVDYITQALENNGRKDILVISADNRKQRYDTIVENFDANIGGDQKKDDYNIIITTEVLAEGVNLHRSNVIVHYDTPWNSTRLMQRIGRVNRIGTKAEKIYNYVFYPSAQGDSQIRLNRTAYMKIQAFHTAFGEDNQVYSEREILDDVKLFKKEAIQEEEDKRLKYLFILRKFRKENKEWFKRIKKLSYKSRTGRSSTLIGKSELSGGTASFLRTSRKFEFYWTDKDQQVKEITPIEAFTIFEAEQKERSAPLIKSHHEHVNMALNHFEKEEQTLVATQLDPKALGGVAMRAKKFLAEIKKYPSVTELQKKNIEQVLYLIDIGKFANLPTEIDRLQKKKLALSPALTELDEIFKKYDIETSEAKSKEKKTAEKGTLIISESFN